MGLDFLEYFGWENPIKNGLKFWDSLEREETPVL